MNNVRSDRNQWKIWLASFLIGLALTALATPPATTRAETSEASRPTTCRVDETVDLNRWPLRIQDLAGCDQRERNPRAATHSPILSRRQIQQPSLNMWPYAFRPQELEPAEAPQNPEDQDHPTTYVRTEPDLRMWPWWPRP